MGHIGLLFVSPLHHEPITKYQKGGGAQLLVMSSGLQVCHEGIVENKCGSQ